MSLVSSLKQSARRTSRAVAMSAAGMICICVGAGFFTSALWMILSRWEGSLFAACVIGGLYAGGGLILVALSGRGSHSPKHNSRTEDAEAMVRLVEGFLTGLDAGRRTARPKPRSHTS
ncbi:phage holin family protein [Puniceibacterium sp. IMCC21224]|uniref:phage holin family protein n=1 Tax=Puniceibacterium sp. IMCC21224 TaxID=1618204 RepID=UPI00064E0C15|nr:phage holin family protein [Puniceibacterium sp. IMCC21224]KMK66111.1 Protein of unknown function (DUF1469) [Puniceibacterium sp. IMCC21224]